jgi:hypothetical protein
MPPTTTTGRQTAVNIDAATRSTTAGFGYANRALAPRAEGLQLLADQQVDRINAAAADSDGQADGPHQKHVFISAGAGRITVWQMLKQQATSISIASAAAKKRVNRPTIKQTPPTVSRNMMTYAHINAGSMPFLDKR